MDTPIFVKIDEYKEILKVADVINEKLENINKSLEDLKKVKDQEDAHIQEWSGQLDAVASKMEYINSSLRE